MGELVKKEAVVPNVFNGDVKKIFPYYDSLFNCSEKYFTDTYNKYQRRNNITFTTENAKTTHEKYMNILIEYYKEINDSQLYKKATELQSHFLKLPIETKRKK